MLTRRRALILAGAGALSLVFPRRAGASVARALSLAELVRQSESVALATALQAESRWETVGRARRIVTYTRLRVDEPFHGAARDSEVLVRTLGGRVGDVGQIVHGEAMLVVGEQAVLFLGLAPDGAVAVAGMSQGHYPVRRDQKGTARLAPSPRLFELVGGDSAVERLSGRTPNEARDLVRKAAGAR
jgi:hypothetical protein